MREPPKENAFTRAAADLGVPLAELKLWLMDALDPSPGQWSHWKYDRRPIGPEHLLEFIRARRRTETPAKEPEARVPGQRGDRRPEGPAIPKVAKRR
jgi:hypothetical protein